MRLVRKSRTSFILAVILFFSIQNTFSQRVTISVNGGGDYEKSKIPLNFEFNESMFIQGDANNYNHSLARLAGALSTISYTDCSAPSTCLMSEAYSKLGITKNDIEYFYDIDYTNQEYGFNQSAFSFAVKKIADGRNLIFIVVRGTPVAPEEWLSNLNVNDSHVEAPAYHEGFFLATKQLREQFEKFVNSRQIDLRNSSIFITGHSRGAAIANLFSALLADDGLVDTTKIFAYTFAAPNVTLREGANDERYNFIWNIVNGEDIVPTLPPTNEKWSFTKFGRTRVIVNSWNCEDFKTYIDVYVEKINKLYKKFLGREYHPFNTGNFIGVKFSDTMSTINRTPKKFYQGFFPLHHKFVRIIQNAFPTTDESTNNSTGGIEKIVADIKKRSDTRTKVLIDYSLNAFVDMHAMQEYLSWIYTLEENEVFCEKENTIVRLKGNFNGAVIDEKGQIYARIYDGVLELRETKAPLAAWQIPIGNFGIISIGFPAQKDYSLLIYKDSLLPTPIKIETRRYASDGLLMGTISKKTLGAHSGIVYNLKTGKSTLAQKDGSKAEYKKLKKDEATLAIKDGKLKNTDVSHMNFEFHFDTDGIVEVGMTSGLQKFYIALLAGADLGEIKKTQLFTMGVGTQHSFCGPLMISAEAFLKFARYNTKNDDNLFAMIPAARVMFSVRPVKRFQIFTATEFNLYFEGFNSSAFKNGYRDGGLPAMGKGDFRVYPAIQFGLKF